MARPVHCLLDNSLESLIILTEYVPSQEKDMKPTRVLVTGGSGYFGSVLVEALRKSGYLVTNFDISEPSSADSSVLFKKGDIRDFDAVLGACLNQDIVFHNVAQVPLSKDDQLFHEVNVTGTQNLLNAALQAKVMKVVYTSSSAVFGIPERNPVDNRTIPRPLEPYGEAKYAGEHLCRAFCERGLDVSIVRPRTILGHGRLGIFGILFDWISDGVDVFVADKGANIYQFIHADDLASAIILAGEKPGCSTFNVGATEYGSMYETLNGLCNFAKTGSKVRSIPNRLMQSLMRILSWLRLAPFAEYHWLLYSKSLYFDNTETIKELGWAPKYSNIEALIESYTWYVSHKDEIPNGRSLHQVTSKQGLLRILKGMLKIRKLVEKRLHV